MNRPNFRFTVLAVIVMAAGLLFYCERNNPYDPKSKSYVPGEKPHVSFVNRTASAWLLDTVSLPILWTDTAIGGGKGAIKTLYIDWSGDTLYTDSIAGNDADTLVIKKAFPVGEYTIRIRAVDHDGLKSDPDSMKLSVQSSRPKLVITGNAKTVRKAAVCTLTVTGHDTGGVIKTFYWAKNGADFDDSTNTGTFQVSFSDTGTKLVLVKARDNKNVVSEIDTFLIAVFDLHGAVLYDGNGNTAGTVPVDANSYIPGQQVRVLGNTGNLEKTGSIFSGWNTSPDGGGASYSAGASFSMDTVSVILYAQWNSNPVYTITYDGNASTGGTVPVDSAHYSFGQSVAALGNSGSLVKSGNTFVGWNTEANGSGIGYAAGVTFFMGSADVTLYAQWSADPTYTVLYRGNTNTGGTIPVDENNYLEGTTVTVLGNTGDLVKTGNTFIGWNTKADGTGTAYAAQATFAMGSANVTLYAQWTALPIFTVTYDGNGNTGGSAPTDPNSYLQDLTVTVRGVGTLVKSGYTFSGWNTQADGGGTSYPAGITFTIGTANVKLYAQWALIPTFTVTYIGNGNTSGAAPSDTNRYSAGQSVVALGNTGTLVKSGFTFIGWNTQADGGGIGYAAEVSFVMGSANITLYAQWTALPTYTVLYDGNGSTEGSVPTDANNYLAGATVTVLGNTSNLIKPGNTFIGWNTQADGGGTSYAAGVTFAIGPANVRLYAHWTSNPTYSVSYNGNGSTAGTAPVDANSYMQGQTITTLSAGILSRPGYSFTGWNTQADGGGIVHAVGTTFAMGSANVTLYAQWSAIPTYSVSYNGNGSASGTAPADNGRYQSGQSVIVLGNTGNLSKAGNTFVGWNTQADGGGIGYAAGVTFVMGSANVTLYAQWSADPTYTVTYRGNTNTGGSAPVDVNHYLLGDTITVLAKGALVKSGFTFVGWNTQADGNGTAYAAGSKFALSPTGNVDLYAQWTSLPTYTVTYDGNGSTGGNAPADANSYLLGQNVTTLSAGTLIRTNYSFTGWNTKSDGSGTAYTVGVMFAIGSANVTLYAQWSAIPTYTVLYAGNGSTGGNAPTDNAHYATGQSVTVLGNTGNLSQTGKTFVGWNTQPLGGGIGYAAGVSFTMGSANVTLYAQWSADPTYTVTYNGNTNTGGSASEDLNHYLLGDTVTVFAKGALVKSGFTFVGWNTQADGNGTAYAAGSKFALSTAGNVTLYAQWTSLPTYTVTYDGNGSTGGGAPTDANNYLQGQVVTALNQGTLTRTNYTFAGWNTKADGSGTNRAVGTTFTMDTTDVILFAQWSAISKHTVTYSGNGGTGGTPPADTNHYALGQTVTVLNNTGALVKTNYAFVGWNTQPLGGGIGYAAGVSFVMGAADDTLYAQWTALPTYTVIYNGNTNTGGNVPHDSRNYLSGDTVTVLGQGTLVKSGYTFARWSTSPVGGTSYDSGAKFAIGSANMTLYAQWSALPTYTVTYNANGGTGNPPVDGNGYLTGATVTVRSAGTLARAGFTFAGWNIQADGNGIEYSPGDTFVVNGQPVTLYAKWTTAISASAGAHGTISPSGTISAVAGQSRTFSIRPDANYHVDSVYVDGTPVAADTTYTFSNISASGTISATFAVNPYSVTYDGNGNDVGTNPPVDPTLYISGQSATVLGQGSLSKAGYTFVGWNTSADGTGTDVGVTMTMTANITLYAKWQVIP